LLPFLAINFYFVIIIFNFSLQNYKIPLKTHHVFAKINVLTNYLS